MERSFALVLIAACEAGTLDLDRLATPDAGNMQCSQLPPRIITGSIEASAGWRHSQPSTDVSGGLIYRHRETPGIVSQIVTFDPLDDTEAVLSHDGTQAYLLDASRGAALWLEQPIGAPEFAVIHRSARGEESVLLEGETTIPTQLDEAYSGRDAVRAAEDSATWRGSDGIWRWDRGSSPRVIFSEQYLDQPSLGEGRIVFTQRGPEISRIMVQEGAGEPEEFAIGDVAWPVSSERWIFYVDAGQLTRLDLSSGEKKTLHEGPCGPPSADRDRVVAACGGSAWPAPGDVIVYWDSVETHELFRDGGYHFAPRLESGRIVWIRYRSSDVVCLPPGDGPAGDVRWWDADISADPIVLGDVAAPCLCCDAFWPAAVVSFEDDVAAWNYSIDGDDAFIGWGRVERQEVCAPK